MPVPGLAGVELTLTGEVVPWRGPAPFHLVVVPPPEAATLRALAPTVSYGWGMVPVEVSIGVTTWTTALWLRDGGYVVPVKDLVRRAEGIELGDVVRVRLVVDG